jgi:ketosteroid isomerase-like protein
MLITALGTLLVTGALSGQGSRSDSSVRDQISASDQKFVAAMKAADARAISQLYTSDAVTAFNTESRGDQIQAYWVENFRTITWEEVTTTAEELSVVGDTAYEWSVWNQRYHRATGAPINQRLRSFKEWKRQTDGSWKIFREVVTVATLKG